MKVKTCNSYGKDFPKTNEFFSYRNKKKGYLSPYCKKCDGQRCRKFYDANYGINKEWTAKRVQQSKEWASRNSEKVKKIKKDYVERNRSWIHDYWKEHHATPEARARRRNRWSGLSAALRLSLRPCPLPRSPPPRCCWSHRCLRPGSSAWRRRLSAFWLPRRRPSPPPPR